MKLFDKNEKYIGNLQYVLEAKHLEEINGEDILTITTLDNRVEKGFRIVYRDKEGNWKEFIIKGIEEIKQPDGIIKSVYCESSFYETLGDYIEDKRPYNTTANIALERALEPTRWEVGIVDDLGINSTNFYHISAKEAVQKVAETWQGELRYRIEVSGNRITGRYVDLLASRGQDLGKRFTYTKDLISITKTVHRDDVITALYGYGKGEEIVDEEGQPTGGYGRRIDFADINNGKAYVENLEAKEIWGRLNPDGTKAHVFGKVEFDDVEDPHELLELTKEKLKELSQPHITYEAKVIDLKALGIEHEGVELGDWVGIVDKEFNPPLRLKARVIKIVKDLLEPENTEITLGNFVPSITDAWLEQEKFISNFRGKQGVWDRSSIIGKDKTIDTQYLDGIIDVLKNKLLASRSGWYTDDRGNLIFENADKTAAMMLTGEGFMIADSKLPNGEYNWRTFGTGSGFVADYIIAGVLKGGKVHFDLTNGTLLIGNSASDYSLLWNGSTLSIVGNINADSGRVGGWTIDTNLYSYNNGTYTTIKSGGDVAFAAGAPTHYDTTGANLQIYHDGVIRLNSEGVRRVRMEKERFVFYDDEGTIIGNIKTDIPAPGFGFSDDWLSITTTRNIFIGQDFDNVPTGLHVAGGASQDPRGVTLLSATSPSNEKYIKMLTKDHFIDIYSANAIYLRALLWAEGDFNPWANNTYNLGSSSYRWKTAYLNSNPNVNSDIRLKEEIQDIPQELIEELREIQPKLYKQYGKWHFGYIAQDIERALYKYALKKVGWERAQDYVREFEVLYKDESYLSLIYAEVAVLKEAEMQKKINDLEYRLAKLEAKLGE